MSTFYTSAEDDVGGKMQFCKKYLFGILFTFIIGICLMAGCRTAVPIKTTMTEASAVRSGDSVAIDYTCRLKDGKILTTNIREHDSSGNMPKAEIYLQPLDFVPLSLTAGDGREEEIARLRDRRPLGLHEMLTHQMAHAVVGKPYDVDEKLALSAGDQDALSEGDRYLRMAKIWKREKVFHLSKKSYEQGVGKTPKIGDTSGSYPGFVARVAEIHGDDVVMENVIASGDILETGFGPGKILEKEDHFEIVLDVFEGKLVRTGDNMGYIHKVDDIFFYVDYGNPYGKAALTCDIRITPSKTNETK